MQHKYFQDQQSYLPLEYFLYQTQELQLQNETLGIQVNVLQKDRSNEGIRNGAIAVIVGFLMGWFFSGSRRSKSSW